jgi:uncharacterized zinc-type alcohol dehydrogenase-like protein
MIRAYAAEEKGAALKPFEYDPGELGPEHVEIGVEYCGICHSDLSVLHDEWGVAQYPFVPGHEVVGKIVQKGEQVTHLDIGQRVGLGWYAESCMTCDQCLSGNHNLCPSNKATMLGQHGGFAEKVRCHKGWATPLPESVDVQSAGPLFCGGITVFNPIVQNLITATDRVGVVGIGGLGHMALAFLRAWGCEVTAFSTSPEKETEAKALGAHYFVNSKETDALKKLAGHFDMILYTINVDLDWMLFMNMLRPKGKLHIVGAAQQLVVPVFPMIVSQLSVGASPLGSPATTRRMLEFVTRHKIKPMVEIFPMSSANDALEKLRTGKPRYRLVLKNDFP